MRTAICALLLTLASSFSFAITKEERKEFLDSIRPAVEKQAGQPIRFKVEKLNIDSEWAVLVGSLLGEEGKRMDWSKAQNCDENLDKMLWVVAQRMTQGWHVKEAYICSPEPPYWNLNPKVAYHRPCGIYAGLDITGSRTAEDECKAFQGKHPVKK
jgi:hypothetical protein